MVTDREWLERALASSTTLDILEWRRQAHSFGQGVMHTSASGRYHPKNRAAVLLRGGLEETPGEVVTALQVSLDAYNRSVVEMEGLIASIGTTLVTHARDKTKALLDGAVAAQSAVGELSRSVEQFAEWKASHLQARAARQRKSNFRVGQFYKALEKFGTPPMLAQYIVKAGLLACPAGVDESSWPLVAPCLMTTITADNGEQVLVHQATWTRPIRFDLSGKVEEGARFSASVLLCSGFPSDARQFGPAASSH